MIIHPATHVSVQIYRNSSIITNKTLKSAHQVTNLFKYVGSEVSRPHKNDIFSGNQSCTMQISRIFGCKPINQRSLTITTSLWNSWNNYHVYNYNQIWTVTSQITVKNEKAIRSKWCKRTQVNVYEQSLEEQSFCLHHHHQIYFMLKFNPKLI